MRQSIRTLLSLLGCLAANALASDPACTPITSIPVVISAPGTYCVMGYLYTTQTSGAAIEIQADDVILDMTWGGLDGGVDNLESTVAGVFAMDRNNITVMNGTIRFFGYGILLENSAADFSNTRGHRVTDMLVEPARRVGIEVRGVDTAVTRTTVSDMGWTGLSYGDASVAAILSWGPGAIVSGNNLVGNETRGAGASAIAIQVYGSANCEVSANRIVNTGALPGESSVAVVVGNSTGCVVRDNEIDNRTTFPLEIGVYMPDSTHVQAISNKMTNVTRHYAR